MRQPFGTPKVASYDVLLIGGAMYGTAIAWWLTRLPDFQGRILVVERDPSYAFSSTARSNSCIRQQFTTGINVEISRFGAQFFRDFPQFFPREQPPQPIRLESFGYLYLASTAAQAAGLAEAQRLQAALGAGTQHLSAAEIQAAYPFYFVDDLLAGNHNRVDEGLFDGAGLFDRWRADARARGVEYLHNQVVGIDLNPAGDSVTGVRLATGELVACGQVVNCAGPRAAEVAAMIGCDLPVEPRKRYSFLFDAAAPLDRPLPLTIDPSGVHVRSDGRYYLAGCPPDDDPAVAADDFEADDVLWEAKVWPVLAHRIPQFDRLKVQRSWVGHYAYNRLDQNAILGPHDQVGNFLFCNGFSGHGLQQSPAVGRALAEWLVHGRYQSLDLSAFGFERIRAGQPFREQAII